MKINERLLRKIILEEVSNATRFTPNMAHLQSLFQKINWTCFQGKLPSCGLYPLTSKTNLGLFSYGGYDNGMRLINPRISINDNYQYTMEELEGLMAHEMIHYYLAYNGTDPKVTHGREFHELADRVSQALGVPITDEVDTSNMTMGNPSSLGISPTLLAYMKSYKGSFENYLPKIKQEGKNKVGQMEEIYGMLCAFTKNLIYALNRAIKKRSLNEANILKPINDFIYGYRKGYNATLNALVGNGKYGYDANTNNPYGSLGGKINSKRLMDLLYIVYPQMKKKYEKVTMGYNSNLISTLFATVDDLKARIDNEAHSNGDFISN